MGALPDDDPYFPVMAENWDTVLAFLNLSTQWRIEAPPMSGALVFHGLPHTEIHATLKLMAVPRKRVPGIFDGLKLMENEALEHLNSK